MTSEQFEKALLDEFKGGMNERYGRVIVDEEMYATAISLSAASDHRVRFRASWALEWAFFLDPERFAPYTAQFFESFLRSSDGSVHRHYTKILCHMLRDGRLTPDDAQAGGLAEKCFDLLIDPGVRVAVKVWCSEILFELSPRIDWVRENLPDTLRDQMERFPTPGMVNHGNKLLRRISAGGRQRR